MANGSNRSQWGYFIISMGITQLILAFIAIGTLAMFLGGINSHIDEALEGHQFSSRHMFDLGHYGREEFFLFGVSVCVCVSAASILVASAGFHDRKTYASFMTAIHLFIMLVMLISGGLLAKKTNFLVEIEFCRRLKKLQHLDASCSQLMIALVAAATSSMLSLVSAVIYGKSLKSNPGNTFIPVDVLSSEP